MRWWPGRSRRRRPGAGRRRAWDGAARASGAVGAMTLTMVLWAGPAVARPAVASEAVAHPAGAGSMVVGSAVAQVTLTPDSGQGPGGPQAQQLVNWIAGMGLIACVAAIVFHAVGWGWGSQQHNMARVQDGKAGVVRAALVAGVIAAAAALINFAAGLGAAVK